MGVPKQRQTKSRRDKRRAHFKIKAAGLTKCSKCGQPVLPHHYCPACGFYNGREVIDVLAKLSKRERKRVEREQKEREKDYSKEKTQKAKGLSMEEMSKK